MNKSCAIVYIKLNFTAWWVLFWNAKTFLCLLEVPVNFNYFHTVLVKFHSYLCDKINGSNPHFLFHHNWNVGSNRALIHKPQSLQLSNFISLYSGLLLFTLYIQGNQPLGVKEGARHIHLVDTPGASNMLVSLCYFKMSNAGNNSFGFPFYHSR